MRSNRSLRVRYMMSSIPWLRLPKTVLYSVFHRRATINLRNVTGIQARQEMEETFRSQIDAVLAATENLVSHNLRHLIVKTSDTIQAKTL